MGWQWREREIPRAKGCAHQNTTRDTNGNLFGCLKLLDLLFGCLLIITLPIRDTQVNKLRNMSISHLCLDLQVHSIVVVVLLSFTGDVWVSSCRMSANPIEDK